MAATPDLLARRLVFVTGKGGVGKSTVVAALGLLAADHGKRVLIVEADAKGNLTDFFEHDRVGFKPVEVSPSVFALTMDTEASLREYLKLHVKVPVIGRIGPLARVFDFVATAAPGVKEILTIGKVAWEVRESIEGRAGWDMVIVDAAATGHVVAQLGAADSIGELVSVGPVQSQTAWMSDLLSDPGITSLNIVATPEEMPVNETIELVERARRELKVPLGSVIVNRVLPELFTRADEETFEALGSEAALDALVGAVAGDAGGPGAGRADTAREGATAVLDAARLAVSLRRARAGHLGRLRAETDLPLLYLPYLFVRSHGLRVTRIMAERLGEELGL